MSDDNKRNYTHIQEVANEVLKMLEDGKTQREISEYYGFKDKYVVKEFARRHRRKERLTEAGITPIKRGKRAKGDIPDEAEKDNEIKRLKMELQLLRSFLQIAGRR